MLTVHVSPITIRTMQSTVDVLKYAESDLSFLDVEVPLKMPKVTPSLSCPNVSDSPETGRPSSPVTHRGMICA